MTTTAEPSAREGKARTTNVHLCGKGDGGGDEGDEGERRERRRKRWGIGEGGGR